MLSSREMDLRNCPTSDRPHSIKPLKKLEDSPPALSRTACSCDGRVCWVSDLFRFAKQSGIKASAYSKTDRAQTHAACSHAGSSLCLRLIYRGDARTFTGSDEAVAPAFALGAGAGETRGVSLEHSQMREHGGVVGRHGTVPLASHP